MHGHILGYDSTEEWLLLRRQGIGASDVAGILGLSPYASPYSVWADKIHGDTRTPSFVMELGHRLEDVILNTFEDQTGLNVRLRQALMHHPDHEWARATVDGVAYESPHARFDAALGVVEAKSTGDFTRWDEVPDQHQLQLQWQMWVTGLERGWLAVLHGGRLFETYEFEADPNVQAAMVRRVTEFRTLHLETGIAPEPDGHDATTESIKSLYDRPDPDKSIELSSLMVADVDALRSLRGQLAELKRVVKAAENRVKVAMQYAEVGTVDGQTVVTWREQTRQEFTVPAASFRVLRLPKGKQ